ncbi:MAG: hypothetical protein COW03_02465 [Cytophagales bacterium CG12_big_fil_rev_8_21_14_0_65_40_12]|nr:MAG: hypothetical protein COW03_02465 [Cytophagales bacterium CG12_big_fil_rev_8_21_14_0_65_40_12]PIW03408.1 MAG: hypothetical protein COW40_14710 [Cytophagales bacterium CG17_big_fil_post_rev_8_21_14_2_50_40_13]
MKFLRSSILYFGLTLFIFFGSTRPLHCQNYYAPSYEEQNFFSFGIGFSGYHGDLQDELILPYPSFGAGFSQRLSPHVHLREDLNIFVIGAKDSDSDYEDFLIRNLSFLSWNLELSVSLEYHFWGQYSHKLREKLNPYFFLGIGLVNVRPTAFYEGSRYRLRPFRTEGKYYSDFALSMPMGVGLRIKANRDVTILAEFGYRLTSTDYLDDVSSTYPDLNAMEGIANKLSDRRQELGYPQARMGGTRGNPDRNDGYFILSFKLEGMFTFVFDLK